MAFRPALRPGAPLLRRDATHLQVGTSPGIVVTDRPGLFALLRLLNGVRDVPRLEELSRAHAPELTGSVGAVLAELRAAGAVIDSADRPWPRGRGTYAVGFDTDPDRSGLVSTARAILGASGITHLYATEPDLLVIASCGEPSRAVFERSTMLGVDHLPVVIDEDRVRIGPLVRPGRTPCVGCHDLHRADWDPAWPALLLQLGRRSTTVGPPSLTATTSHAAAVELASEVLAQADGRDPRTIGQCLVIGPDHHERVLRPVSFHPRCTCDLLNAA